jgi:hypothetical protein
MRNRSELNFTKSELLLLVLVASIILTFAWIFWVVQPATMNTVNSGPSKEAHVVNYVMAKINSVMSLFSLEGREINRKFISLDDQVLASGGVSIPAVRGMAPVALIDVNAAATPGKGKKLVSKNGVKTAAPVKSTTPAVAKKANPKVTQSEREKRLAEWDDYNAKMKIYEEKKKSLADKKAAAEQQFQQNQNSQYQATFPVPSTEDANPTKETPKKSIDEWKQELATAINNDAGRSLIVKFVGAYKSKEVDEIDFYATVQAMLKSNNDAQKGLGLYALRGAPSYASYLLLVKQQSEFSPTLQTYIQETLMSYHQGGLGTLQQALSSKDNQVITKTLEILKTGVNSIKNGNNELVDPRYRRDTVHPSINVKNYLAFGSILQQLSTQGGSSEIKSYAIELNQLINSAQTTNQPVVASTP